MPDVGEVPSPAAGDDEPRVDAHVVAIAHEAGREALGGGGDAAKAPVVERERCCVFAGPRLHLDEGERARPPGDDIHFTAGHTDATRKDPPAVKPQIPAGEGLGAAAPPFSLLAAHSLRSSARG